MPSPGKVVCVANRKGGVGKTTATVVIAHTLQQAGRTVAVIDVDPQGSATYALAGERLPERMSEIMLEGTIQRATSFPASRPIEDFAWGQVSTLTNRPDVPIALIPCSPALWDLEDKLSDRVFTGSMAEQWSRLLMRLKQEFEVVLIDTAPGRSFFGLQAMMRADCILVPCDATKIAVRAMGVFARELKQRRKLTPRRALGKAVMMWTKHAGIDQIDRCKGALEAVLNGAGVDPIPDLMDGAEDANLKGLQQSPVFSRGLNHGKAESYESVYGSHGAAVARAVTNALLSKLGLGGL